MIKILILFTIIILSTSLGILLSTDKKRRMEVFSELYEFNERLILNLKFGKVTINKVLQDFPTISKIMSCEQRLNAKDNDFFQNYMLNLGHTDAISQIDYLNEKKVYLKKYKDDSFNDYKKYGALYVKIFFMVGILIAVLLA